MIHYLLSGLALKEQKLLNFEPNDRSRVSAFARLYGYDSDKHPNSSSLYITIGSADYPQNNQGFFLEVDEGNF